MDSVPLVLWWEPQQLYCIMDSYWPDLALLCISLLYWNCYCFDSFCCRLELWLPSPLKTFRLDGELLYHWTFSLAQLLLCVLSFCQKLQGKSLITNSSMTSMFFSSCFWWLWRFLVKKHKDTKALKILAKIHQDSNRAQDELVEVQSSLRNSPHQTFRQTLKYTFSKSILLRLCHNTTIQSVNFFHSS